MDFSLLVGILPPSHSNPTRPILRIRLVDYIGAFTLAKQLESSSKKALKSSSEAKGMVTVLPPHEYAKRFFGAIRGYFVGVPRREGGWEGKMTTNWGEEGKDEEEDGGLIVPSVL